MSDQDNLRDRIASAVERADAEASDGGFAIAMPDHVAQAIIDELGLTVETSIDLGALPDHLQGVWMDDPAFREWEAKQPRKTRVVGKWEKQ